jgi:hypothetical protein
VVAPPLTMNGQGPVPWAILPVDDTRARMINVSGWLQMRPPVKSDSGKIVVSTGGSEIEIADANT